MTSSTSIVHYSVSNLLSSANTNTSFNSDVYVRKGSAVLGRGMAVMDTMRRNQQQIMMHQMSEMNREYPMEILQ